MVDDRSSSFFIDYFLVSEFWGDEHFFFVLTYGPYCWPYSGLSHFDVLNQIMHMI